MVEVLGVLNYGLVLLYGVLLSVSFAGGCASARERRSVAALCVMLLAAQTLCWSLWGLELTKQYYPLISHLPLVITLVLVLKKSWGVAAASVLTAYFCCELPRWIGTIALYVFGSELAYQLVYLISVFPVFFLLWKYFSLPACRAMTYSSRPLLFFGGLPLFYYLFDYATTVYTKTLYEGILMISEFLPAAMALFYMVFVAAYHAEMQRRSRMELQNSMLEMQFEQAKNDVASMKQMQEQTAAYRHDMRHHFVMIDGYLKTGDTARASEYIQSAQRGIERITAERYCANVAVNLLLSAYAVKAKKQGIELSVEANIPDDIPISETELSALLSNGIENAVSAAARCGGETQRIVRINCQLHRGNVLISIKNPHVGKLKMRNGLPQSSRPEHGFGVKSIKMIAEMHGGYYSFKAQDGVFTLKVVLPLGNE